MKFINLTPHAIHVLKGERIVEFPASGQEARLATQVVPAEAIDGFAVNITKFSAVEGLPEPQTDTVFIVSALIVGQTKDRTDVVAPDTGKTAIRENGQIKAVRGFIRIE